MAEHEGGPEYAGPSLTNAQYASLLAENARLREALKAARDLIAGYPFPLDFHGPLDETMAAISAALSPANPSDVFACATCDGRGYYDDHSPCDDCKGTRISPAFANPNQGASDE